MTLLRGLVELSEEVFGALPIKVIYCYSSRHWHLLKSSYAFLRTDTTVR